jgi:uncharacterized protein YigA (DUF484 family)
MNDQDIADYLHEHRDFFQSHMELLAELRLPNPHGEQAISIAERQVILLRDRVHVLESKLAELIAFAEDNDAIGEKMQRLALALMRADSVDAIFASLYLRLTDDFSVPHAALRAWGPLTEVGMREFSDVPDDIRTAASALTLPQCGKNAPEGVLSWFEGGGEHLRSFALIPFAEDRLHGLLVLASEDETRFYPEMGTLYLKWLGEMVSASLSRTLAHRA